MQMTCPKCHGELRQYERSGVLVDQCGDCRGIFLDRGELEKLFDAEANWNRQHAGGPQGQPTPQPGGGYPPPPVHQQPAHQQPVHQQPGYQQPGYGAPSHVPPPVSHGYPPAPMHGGGGQYGYHGHYRQKRQKSFLNELFD